MSTHSFDHAAAVRMLSSGASQSEVASHFGVSKGAVQHAIRVADRELGSRVPRPAVGRRATVDRAAASELVQGGLCQRAVARQLGCSESAVSRALHAHA
ncbi:MAG: helix-turn-helix domain-containing protein [Janthinobacterium lividum]